MSLKKKVDNPWSPELWTAPEAWEFRSWPKVTFGILSHDRKDDLRRTLDCLTKGIEYPNSEIIVIDNASVDLSAEMVRAEFPGVRLFALEQNLGVPARNLILDNANGEFIFFFDDDSFPATPATIHRIVDYLLENPGVTALSAIVLQPHTAVCETVGWTLFSKKKRSDGVSEGIYFHEAGGCLRRSSMHQIRFEEYNLFYAEGHDFALRLFEGSRTMTLHPQFAVLHAKSSKGHPRSLDRVLKATNMIKMLFKNFSLPFAWFLVTMYCLRRLVGFAIRPSTTKAYLRGIQNGVRDRKPFILFQPKIQTKAIFRLFSWYLFMLRW